MNPLIQSIILSEQIFSNEHTHTHTPTHTYTHLHTHTHTHTHTHIYTHTHTHTHWHWRSKLRWGCKTVLVTGKGHWSARDLKSTSTRQKLWYAPKYQNQ